jgi:ubiquitin-protein ligase
MVSNKRREKDVMKLLVSEYEVQMADENSSITNELIVKFQGPKESPYEDVSAT